MQSLVRNVSLHAHPDADAIEIARVDGYQAIVPKGLFTTGDLAVYIPEGALLPESLLAFMGLTGRLSRTGHNVVKAIKLRGVVSQGLLLPLWYDAPYDAWYLPPVLSNRKTCVIEGDDVGFDLGITKYEPKVSVGHRLYTAPEDSQQIPFTTFYDMENIKKCVDMFSPYDLVVATEKVHGTLVAMCATVDGDIYASSKGILRRGYGYLPTVPNNVYAVVTLPFCNALTDLAYNIFQQPVILFGEIYGAGIQDLEYGASGADVRFFDILVGNAFLTYSMFVKVCQDWRLPTVPVLYQGPYEHERLLTLATGRELVSGRGTHLREGLVVKSVYNERHPYYGRKIVKYINDAYLLRHGGTEYS